jgi:hypothetical protein
MDLMLWNLTHHWHLDFPYVSPHIIDNYLGSIVFIGTSSNKPAMLIFNKHAHNYLRLPQEVTSPATG